MEFFFVLLAHDFRKNQLRQVIASMNFTAAELAEGVVIQKGFWLGGRTPVIIASREMMKTEPWLINAPALITIQELDTASIAAKVKETVANLKGIERK